MQYFEWLGVTPAESIGLIKKISKKKISIWTCYRGSYIIFFNVEFYMEDKHYRKSKNRN